MNLMRARRHLLENENISWSLSHELPLWAGFRELIYPQAKSSEVATRSVSTQFRFKWETSMAPEELDLLRNRCPPETISS